MVSVGGGLWPQISAPVAKGGTTDQAYVKQSLLDYDAAWVSAPNGVPYAPVYASGQWYDQRETTGTSVTQAVPTPQTWYMPWYLPKRVTIDALAATSASTQTGSVICSVLEYLSSLQPGRVLARTATLSVTTAASVIGTVTPVTLDAGWYFWGYSNAGGGSVSAVGMQNTRNPYPLGAVLNQSSMVPGPNGSDPLILTAQLPAPTDYPYATVAAASANAAVLVPFRIA